jgi:hypothetical protein
MEDPPVFSSASDGGGGAAGEVTYDSELRKLKASDLLNQSALMAQKMHALRAQVQKDRTTAVDMNPRLLDVLSRVYSDAIAFADKTDRHLAALLDTFPPPPSATFGKRSMSDVFSESSDLIAGGDVGSPKRMKKKNLQRSTGGAPDLREGDEVAARVSPNKREWILARVASIKANGKYEVEDEDPGDEEERVPIRKKFVLPREALISLMGQPVLLPKGSAVLAMFPDTTTFYQAVVLHPPKKHSNYVLKFNEDGGEERLVAARYVVPSPF